ncbi:hypothetical protein SAY87_024351 [Trapa incisa]|uniref:RING-type E3 ubiquitin transferase n=1 Tax=Trapa incisa TaxID=236973 RepID=A0AAN7GJS0_9MYRT|nr:hypothetical protein SAY87_024351 [Trapa incisa]
MGALCCCARTDDFEEYALPSTSMYRHCICLRFFLNQLLTGYRGVFHRIGGRPVTAQIQGTAVAFSSINILPADNSMNESHVSISRSLPYDSETRYTRLQRDGLVSRRDKSMSHFQEDAQPVRRNVSSSGMESLGLGKRRSVIDLEEDCKFGLLESSDKALNTRTADGLIDMQSSSDDEDICPTCLEEYTPENPKITTQCSHHFHLGCIYEWMERSESCPICGKAMEFCESP